MREHGDIGLKVVAALMDMDVAATAEENLKPFLNPLRCGPDEGHKADVAIRIEDVLECRFAGHLLLNLRSH